MFDFWHRWLLVAAAAFLVAGPLFAFFSETVLFAPLMEPIETGFWGASEPSAEAARYSRFLFGIIGALTAAFGALAFLVARHAVARREAWAWRALAASLAVWYAIDSAVSAHFGVYVNVVSNTGIALAMAIPTAGLQRYMARRGLVPAARPADA